jgi:membrane dipeptidase
MSTNEEEIQQIAKEIHFGTTVVDSHHDILIDILESRQRGLRGRISQYWVPKLEKGGVRVQVFPVYIDTWMLPELALRRTLQMVEAFHSDLEDDHSRIVPVDSYDGIQKVTSEGKIAAILGLEGAEGLGNDVGLFHTFYRLGMRVVALTWNRRTAFADGTGEQGTHGGLTKLGFAAIHELNRLNILIDVSHINEASFFDVMKTTNQTVIASHSNVKGIYDHPRNLSDDQIRALAQNGGVMGLLIHPGIIDPQNPTLSRCVDHLAYVANLVGVDHVGIGSDFMEDALVQNMGAVPSAEAMVKEEDLVASIRGCGRIDELSALTVEMVRRGFTKEEIQKILSGNFMRVSKKVLV